MQWLNVSVGARVQRQRAGRDQYTNQERTEVLQHFTHDTPLPHCHSIHKKYKHLFTFSNSALTGSGGIDRGSRGPIMPSQDSLEQESKVLSLPESFTQPSTYSPTYSPTHLPTHTTHPYHPHGVADTARFATFTRCSFSARF